MTTTRTLNIRDENGKGIDFAQYEEVVLISGHFDIPRRLKTIKDLKYEDRDVFICGYPKSGNHWVSAMVYLLQHSTSLDMVQSLQLPAIPLVDVFSTKKIVQQPRPRTMVSHLWHKRLPGQFLDHGGKIVFLLRNPKDVAVSFFFHNQKHNLIQNPQSWTSYLKCFGTGEILYGSYFDYLDSWQQILTDKRRQTEILVVYYEDLVHDCFKELLRLQSFLGMGHSDELLQAIAKRCSFGSLQQNTPANKTLSRVHTTDGQNVLYRKGKVRDWRNHFTEEQNKEFEKICEERLKHSMFTFQYDNRTPVSKL